MRSSGRAVEAGADVLILAGAPLAGMAASLRGEIRTVLLDLVQCAAMQAVALTRLAPGGASAGSFARPPTKETTSLSPALAAQIARTHDGD